MASFGRRPDKKAGASKSGKGSAGADGESEAYKKLKEEMAEREHFAREHAKKSLETQRLAEQQAKEPPEEQASSEPSRTNPRVFLDIEVRGPELLGRSGKVEAEGRMEFELFADSVPKTAENFRCLCTGERGAGLTFQQSFFHRIIPGFMAQGGDITDGDGTGGQSIYGKRFEDENFSRRHEARGTLSMANSGPNSNNSQFFISFKATPHLDRKHVVFGRLVHEDGQLLRKIEDRGTKSGDPKGAVAIVRSGQLPTKGASRERRRSRSRSARSDRSDSRRRRRR